MFVSFGRILKSTWRNIYRNLWVSLATISVIMVALFIVGSLILLNRTADVLIDVVRSQLNASVYFHDGVEEEYVLNIQKKISEHEKVLPSKVSYISELKVEQDSIKNNPLLAETVNSLDGLNPLGAIIHFEVESHTVEDYNIVGQYISCLLYTSPSPRD